MKKIITDIEKLSQSCVELDVKQDKAKIFEVVSDIKAVMKRNNLSFLSAPQIGHNYRIFCVRFNGIGKRIQAETIVYINPIIVGSKNIILDREQDPCFPNKEFIIPRSEQINLIYSTIDGKPLSTKFEGKVAMVMQLMVDHLDGVLLIDTGLEIDKRFDNAPEEEKNNLLNAYMESLKEYQENLLKDIESNAELKQMKDAIDFIQSVKEGKTQLGEVIKNKVE